MVLTKDSILTGLGKTLMVLYAVGTAALLMQFNIIGAVFFAFLANFFYDNVWKTKGINEKRRKLTIGMILFFSCLSLLPLVLIIAYLVIASVVVML